MTTIHYGNKRIEILGFVLLFCLKELDLFGIKRGRSIFKTKQSTGTSSGTHTSFGKYFHPHHMLTSEGKTLSVLLHPFVSQCNELCKAFATRYTAE